jgi:hypothetical protein
MGEKESKDEFQMIEESRLIRLKVRRRTYLHRLTLWLPQKFSNWFGLFLNLALSLLTQRVASLRSFTTSTSILTNDGHFQAKINPYIEGSD